MAQNNNLIRIKRNRTKIEIYSKCPKSSTGQFVYELSCNQYLNCWKGRGYVQNCAPGTLFNPKTLECDHAEKVQCVTGPRQSMLLHHYEKLTKETQPGCPNGFSGIIPHYTDCSKFISCDRGKENVMDCAPGTLFDVNSNNCNHPHSVQCVNQQLGVKGPVLLGSFDYDNQRASQNQKLSSSRLNGQDQNVGTVHQSRSDGFGQEQYNENEGFYGTSYQGVGFKPNYQISSNQFDQNLERYDQNVESSSLSRSHISNGRYRPVNNVTTIYQRQYDQNLRSVDRVPRYRPIHNVDSASQTIFNQENAEEFSSYARGHQINAYRPTSYDNQASSTNYRPTSYDEQNLQASRPYDSQASRPNYGSTGYDEQTIQYNSQSSRPIQGFYSQNQQLLLGPTSSDEQLDSPKCPEGGAGLYTHPYDCSKFLNCANGLTYIQDCAPGTLFNPVLKVCDFPYNVRCSSSQKNQSKSPSENPQTKHPQTNHQQRPVGGNTRPTENLPTRYPQWRPIESNVQYSSTRRPTNHQSSDFYSQQNKNFEHRPFGQWSNQNGQEFKDQSNQQQAWIPIEAETTTTNVPLGFYVTKPPQTLHTPKPDDFARTYETPDVDYIYEYDDDIIVDAQPASSNKKVQNIACRAGQYTCPNNHCIANLAVCDGFRDCIDASDENNCDLVKFASTRNNKLAVAEKKKIANTTTVSCAKYCLDEMAFQCRAFNYRFVLSIKVT